MSQDPQGIENDGCDGANCTAGQDATPFTIPMVANFTIVGFPNTVTVPAGGGRGKPASAKGKSKGASSAKSGGRPPAAKRSGSSGGTGRSTTGTRSGAGR